MAVTANTFVTFTISLMRTGKNNRFRLDEGQVLAYSDAA
jgi:hypothetical protein